MLHHLTKVTRTATIVEPSLIESITVPNCPRHVHQPQHNHGRTDHGLKQINHGKVVGYILDGSEYHNWRWLLTNKRITHWRQIETTVTIGEHHDPHHISQSNLSVFSAVVNPVLSSMSTRVGESFATSASAKQKQAHCLGLSRSTSTRIPSWRRLQA